MVIVTKSAQSPCLKFSLHTNSLTDAVIIDTHTYSLKRGRLWRGGHGGRKEIGGIKKNNLAISL